MSVARTAHDPVEPKPRLDGGAWIKRTHDDFCTVLPIGRHLSKGRDTFQSGFHGR
jgi:hypothetical protein